MAINSSDDDCFSDDDYASDQSNVAGKTSKDAHLPSETVWARTAEGCSASSSSSHLKSYFEGMGFSPVLVERVINENGEADANSLLEALFSYSALQAASSEHHIFPDVQASSKLEMGCPSGNFPVSSCQEFNNDDQSCSMDFSLGSSEEIEEDLNECEEVSSDKRNSLRLMKFSEEEVDCAITSLGEDASLTDMVEFILAAQTAGSFEEDDENMNHSDHVNDEVISNATLFNTMEKTQKLLEMGFSGNEVSEAINNFGAELPVSELADSIFAQQHANMPDSSNPTCCLSSQTDLRQLKRAKASSSKCHSDLEDWKFTSMREVKQEVSADLEDGYDERRKKLGSHIGIYPSLKTPKLEVGKDIGGSSSHGRTSKTSLSDPPFFLYGAVVELSSETWPTIANYLYQIVPEHTDASFFSALMRKEGYIHNLPTTNRTHVLPEPLMTIIDIFPHMKNWWPSWDTRKKLGSIWPRTLEVHQTCRRLEKILLESQGMISKEQQQEIIDTCMMMNLTWVGLNKLGPFEPGHLEEVLGYPSGHTQIGDLQKSHRFRLLEGSFQTDTLGYHLSSLKRMFPDGLRLLSIFSGIGGAVVSLHRLGIRLRAVVCVEPSRQNQEIIRRWWSRTGQRGELEMVEDIKKFRVKKLSNCIEKFGGFDLVVAGNPSSHVDGEKSGEVDFPLFFEFDRVLKRLRHLMKRHR